MTDWLDSEDGSAAIEAGAGALLPRAMTDENEWAEARTDARIDKEGNE